MEHVPGWKLASQEWGLDTGATVVVVWCEFAESACVYFARIAWLRLDCTYWLFALLFGVLSVQLVVNRIYCIRFHVCLARPSFMCVQPVSWTTLARKVYMLTLTFLQQCHVVKNVIV